MKTTLIALATLILLFLLLSCEEKGEITVGSQESFKLLTIDTLTLSISTIHVDSVATNGSSLLLGKYDNPRLGPITIKSYFQPSLGNEDLPEEEDSYDSLGLIIYPYLKHYGPGGNQTINIYKINEEFKPEDGDEFYQFNELTLENAPIGSFILEANRNPEDSIFIKLLDVLGNDLFQKAIERNDILKDNSDFKKYLDGFAFVPEDQNANVINSLLFNDKNIKFKLYYHRDLANGNVNKEYEFPINSTGHRFNQVQPGGNNSLISQIISNKELHSKQTSGMSFIQGSSALVTKINIPYLQDIETAFYPYALNSAVLEIRPATGSHSKDTPLPEEISLLYLSKFDKLDEAFIVPPEGRSNTANLELDEEQGQYTKYEIDVTAFIVDQIRNQGLKDESFYLSLVPSQFNTNISTVVINASKFETKLKLYISKYAK